MAKGTTTVGDRIRLRLKELGKSEAWLARQSGVSQPVINDLVNNRQKSTKFLPEIAAALDLTPTDLDPRYRAEPVPAAAPAQLPVYSAVEAGPGFLVVSTDPVRRIPRPSEVEHVRDAYAVMVVGDSMLPRYEPGEIVICNPRLPPVRGKDCIFATDPDDRGEFRATLKRLVKSDPLDWLVEQFNPPDETEREFRLPKSEWPKCMRVTGRWDG